LALDPKSADAQIDLAVALVGRVLAGFSASAASDLARAKALVDQALPASPRSEYAHFVKGEMLRAQNRPEEAVPEYEMALAINRNFSLALHGLAWCKLYAGLLDAVIPLEEEAIRLSPRDPGIVPVRGDWNCASTAIAHRRSDRLARKSAQHDVSGTVQSPPPSLRLCPRG